MTKIRLLLASILALLAVGAVTATGAMAEACVTSKTQQCFDVEGVLTASAPIINRKEPGTESLLEVTGLGRVVCEKANSVGTIEETATGVFVSGVVITFSGKCELVGTTCKVTEPITTNKILGSIANVKGEEADVSFAPESGTLFAEVKITNCVQAATLLVTGKQLCLLLTAEKLEVVHLLDCETTGSELKNGEKTAFFDLVEEVELESKKPWAILAESF